MAFEALWQLLDQQGERVHGALLAKLAELVPGQVGHYVVQQVMCFDRLRDVWIRLMLDWILSFKVSALCLCLLPRFQPLARASCRAWTSTTSSWGFRFAVPAWGPR